MDIKEKPKMPRTTYPSLTLAELRLQYQLEAADREVRVLRGEHLPREVERMLRRRDFRDRLGASLRRAIDLASAANSLDDEALARCRARQGR